MALIKGRGRACPITEEAASPISLRMEERR
jgi:hypothetical protein